MASWSPNKKQKVGWQEPHGAHSWETTEVEEATGYDYGYGSSGIRTPKWDDDEATAEGRSHSGTWKTTEVEDYGNGSSGSAKWDGDEATASHSGSCVLTTEVAIIRRFLRHGATAEGSSHADSWKATKAEEVSGSAEATAKGTVPPSDRPFTKWEFQCAPGWTAWRCTHSCDAVYIFNPRYRAPRHCRVCKVWDAKLYQIFPTGEEILCGL